MEDNKALFLGVSAAVVTGAACYYLGLQEGKKPKQLNFLGDTTNQDISTKSNKSDKTSAPLNIVIPPKPTDEAKLKFYTKILDFVNGQEKTLVFGDINSFERHLVHELSESFGVSHTSKDIKGKRVLEISKEAPTTSNNNNNSNGNYSKFITIPDKAITEDTVHALIQNQNTLYQLLVEKVLYSPSNGGGDQKSNNNFRGGKKDGKDGKEVKEGKLVIRGDSKLFDSGIDGTKDLVFVKDDNNFLPTPNKPDNSFRYVNWNIEWMEYIFESNTTFAQNGSHGIGNVKELCDRIAGVIKDINADIICVLEGPQSVEKLDLFVTTYLESSFEVLGGIDGMDQRVYFLIKKGGPLRNPKIHEDSLKYLQKSWWFDIEGTCDIQEYKFTRIPCPIVCEITINGENKEIYFFGTHTKSKFVSGGQAKWKSKHVSEQLEFIKKSVSNRRRITGELSRLRSCIERIMKKDSDAHIVVSGDLNDGPGMDFFEKYYLLHDSLAALIGSPFEEKRVLHSVLLEKAIDPDHLFTCVFEDYVDNIADRKTLIDHILVSRLVGVSALQAGVSHDIFLKYTSGRKRDEYPSDHRPVFGDFKI